ncbi:response regulator transcription factor [Actinospica durhamensis]|uniref:response regulator transcription factor n=1 Tax=Actinospica durhamensis TaxID=1508375 RepID=UPI0027DE95B6|nr:response regulator transcription factor [Actinospica durhamensis]
MTETTVLIVDDLPLQRSGFRMLLESNTDTSVVGEASHGAEAVRLAAALKPDVVLMDIRMPGMDGIEATRRIVESGGRSRVLVLTTFDLDAYVYAALRAGASGFLLKDALPQDLISGIRAVASGDAVVAPALTKRLLDAYIDSAPTTPDAETDVDERLAVLTDREREVMEAVARGLTNREIAEQLVLSESTIKTHVSKILTKIDARDRVHAVIIAYETGLVSSGRTGRG